jgi:hypothetical protein
MNRSFFCLCRLALGACALLTITSPALEAHESIFAFTYTTDLLPKGKSEFEQWVTWRRGKAHGDFDIMDFREEIEYGITDNFQASLYVNHAYHNAYQSFPAGPGGKGGYITGGEGVSANHDPKTRFRQYHFDSISTELIYRLLSPYKDPLGLAIYMEPEIGPDEVEIEWKILLQKNFIDDRFVIALNANYGLEWEKEDPEFGTKGDSTWQRAAHFEWFAAASYRFVPKWSAGLEFWNHHEFADAEEHEHSAFFVGPVLHYGTEGWWASLGFLRQLPIGSAYSQDNKDFAYDNGYIFGEEHEKWYWRLRVGINF